MLTYDLSFVSFKILILLNNAVQISNLMMFAYSLLLLFLTLSAYLLLSSTILFCTSMVLSVDFFVITQLNTPPTIAPIIIAIKEISGSGQSVNILSILLPPMISSSMLIMSYLK